VPKVRVQVSEGEIHVDQVIEGATDEEVVAGLRDELIRKAGFLKGAVIRAIPEEALWGRIVEAYNSRHGKSEPPPQTASDFLAFGERAGYVTRLG